MKYIILLLALQISVFSSFSQSYSNAESVEYDPINDRWLVSNRNRIISDDGQGNLTYFGNGSASHGLEVVGSMLFGVDGSTVRGFDLDSENEVTSIRISGARFLNGLASAGNNILYTTDFTGKKIYKLDFSDLSNPSSEEIVSNTQSTPNGIIYDGANNRLIYTSWGSNAEIKQVDLSNNSVSTIINTNLGNIDGIDDDANGNYYISSWSPDRITRYNSNFQNPVTVTTPSLDSPADIGISKSSGVIGIPMGDSVIFVESGVLSVSNFDYNTEMKIVPNPVVASSKLMINSTISSPTKIELLDLTGRHIKTISENISEFKNVEIPLSNLNVHSGVYFIKLSSSKGTVATKKVVVN